MKSKMAALAAVLMTLFLTTVTRAGPILSLSTTEPNLNNLMVGQTVTFDVNLSGLGAGEQIGYLAIQVVYDGTLLSSPTINAGAIVPDLTGFAGLPFTGIADGSYDSLIALSGDPITTNGVFFTFEVTVLQAGSGVLDIDVVASEGLDASNNPLASATPDAATSFSTSTSSAVPDPGTGFLLAMGLLSLAGWRYWPGKVFKAQRASGHAEFP